VELLQLGPESRPKKCTASASKASSARAHDLEIFRELAYLA